MTDWFMVFVRALAIAVLFIFTDAARAEYVRQNPGQPGWAVSFFGWGAILILVTS